MARALVVAAGAAVTAMLAFCETPAPQKEAAPRVGVFLDFDSAPGKTSVEVMKKEVDSLLKPSGVALDWRLAGENRGGESYAGLVVLKFKGKCKVEAWQQESTFAPGETRSLGWTWVEDGHVLPFSEVECDEVKQALAFLHPGAGRGERQQALGLAMGRVVAHEIYHVLARTTAHAARGIAKAAESLQDLVSGWEILLRAEDAKAIRRGIAISH